MLRTAGTVAADTATTSTRTIAVAAVIFAIMRDMVVAASVGGERRWGSLARRAGYASLTRLALPLFQLHEKRLQLRHRIAVRRRPGDVGDVVVKPRDVGEHVAARRAVFEEMPDLLHLGDPAVGLGVHARHLPRQPA